MTASGASLLAIIAMGTAAPAWAQDAAADQDASAQTGDDLIMGEEIVVTGRREALQSADERKKNADTIIDSVVADDAGKLPDNSITEVLQRVSGVTIVRFSALNDPDHFSVEGSGIQVRGLSGVASRLNGREIFSANAGRSLLWGDVTPELMQAVDVYKSSSADQIEGGTGGSVDLRTKLPFDFDMGLHAAGSADVSVGDLADEADYSVSGLIAGHWDTPIGEVGLLVDGAYSQLTSRSQFFRIEPYFLTTLQGDDYFVPGGFDYGEQAFQRKRDGIYAAAQWAPNDDLTFTGIFFQSRYRNRGDEWAEIVAQQTFAVDPTQSQFDSNGVLVSTPNLYLRDPATFNPTGGAITQGGTTGVNKTRTKTQDMSIAFAWAPADSRVAIRGSYQHIFSTSEANSLSVFRDFSGPTGYGLDLTGDLPSVTVPGGFGQAQYDDQSRYLWTAAMPHNEDNTGKMDSAALDIEYDVDSSFFRKVKVGGRWSNRTERDFNNGYAWAALGRGWNGDPQLTFVNSAPGDSELHPYKDFFRGAIALPGQVYYPSLALAGTLDVDLLHRSPPAGFCADPYYCVPSGPLPQSGYGGSDYRQSGFLLPNDQRDFSTRTLAGYIMTTYDTPLGDGNLSGNVGVRVVNVKNESQGVIRQLSNTYIRNGQTVTLAEVITPREGGGNFTRFLPAINVIYAPDDKIRVRGAYNITMDNASFQALSAAGEVGVATTANPVAGDPGIFNRFTTTQGAPDLEPTMSNNFDLSFEWYPRPGTTFHIAGFYKRLTNLPIYAIQQRPVTIYYNDGTTEDTMATSNAVRNSEEAATVKGVEVGGRVFLDSLPGWLNGIGLEANYTFIDSANPGDIYRDILGNVQDDAPLQGLSRHNFNVAFLYEHDPISFRVAYSWRSKYLQSTNSNGTNPLFNYYPAPGAPVEEIQLALPVYGSSYGSLDAGVTFRVTEAFSFTIQGTNLTNATQKTLMGGYPNGSLYTRSWFQSDRRVKVGVNVAF
ncbi:TonB-dependent receptor [Stakelama tenebrarum]|nr:TonB-dependent receptor [Sphingosinithalassobacter tenebrarum]